MTPLRSLILSFVLGIGAWIILANIEQQTTLQPLIACAEVAKTQTIGLRENTSQPLYTLQIPLVSPHSEGVAVVQLVAVGRSGWNQYPIPAIDIFEIDVYKPSDLLLLRYGLVTPQEALRAQKIEEAAKHWQWPEWWKVKGWKSPLMTLCKTFSEFK